MRAAVLLWASFALGIAGQGQAVADPEVKANEIIDFFRRPRKVPPAVFA